ncbi:MAG: endonuclease [Cyanobacteria bacterium J06638_20]
MRNHIATVIRASVCAVFLGLFIFIVPALALEIEFGQQVELKARSSLGVPLHELPQPSLFGRAPDRAKATVIGFDDQKRWINIQLSDSREGWIVERYIGKVLTTEPDGSPPDSGTVPDDDIVQPPPIVEPGRVIFPGQSGDQLLRQLKIMYSPLDAVGYRKARDLLYSQIDNEAGIVEGIYTGYRARISRNSRRPRSDATAAGINAEHVWPQSKGATGAAKSDMHHLFPARVEVNGDRGNYPFADIPDNQTDSWYLDDEEEFVKPAPQVIDLYSEGDRGAFEPRESKKGDIARAMFYFQTIYPNRADDFFNAQQTTLCAWVEADPADAGEIERSHKIFSTDQGNENPFVLDETLPQRTYCN